MLLPKTTLTLRPSKITDFSHGWRKSVRRGHYLAAPPGLLSWTLGDALAEMTQVVFV
jgi:hypothetical protein